MNQNKKWFAVHTRARWEKKVAEIFTRRKIENYCPLNKVVHQWSDRRKIVHEPLFTSYVFVRVSETEVTSLKQTSGVISLVYWLGKPAVIRDVEIETIKAFLSEHINIKLEKTRVNVNVNDKIKVIGGPLRDREGQVLTIGNTTARVALPSLGYMMYAEVEIGNIKVMEHVVPTEIIMHYSLYAAQAQ
jgi:transcription antitermination factor NusG